MKCAKQDCTCETVGKSRYCTTHRAESRANFKKMVAEQTAERKERYEGFEKIWQEAEQAGLSAGEGKTPVPMVVQQHGNMVDDSSPVVKEWVVSGGVCGFAWVVVRPANSSFAIWAKKNHKADKDYYGGMNVKWVHEFGQSMERKEAYAHAFAEVLRKHGIKASARSRMD